MAIIQLPFIYVPDPTKGRPLFGGQIFVGIADLDPEIPSNQVQLNVVQEDGTVIPVPQPFILGPGGVPQYNGATVRLDTDGNYSLKILDKNGAQTYYIENVFEGEPVTELEAIARALNVLDSQVIYSTDTATVLDDVLYIYDSSAQTTWGVPTLLTTGETIQSVSGNTLITDPSSTVYTLKSPTRYSFDTVADAQEANYMLLGSNVTILERGDALFKVVTGEVATGYGVIEITATANQMQVQNNIGGAKLVWYGVIADKINDDLPATQEAVNDNPLTLWPAGDLFFNGQLEAPTARHTKYQGQGLGITNVYGVDGQQLTTLEDVDCLSVTARDITFDGEFYRTGLTYPYYTSGAAAPKGAKWAFTFITKTNCDIDYSDCEFRNFYELPFAVFNGKGKVRFNNNVVWKCKDVGFVNCDDVEMLNNKSYFAHDNGFSLSRGNKNVRARGNLSFSPAFVGIALYGFQIDGVDELGPDGFDLSGNFITFSGQANISNVRGPRNGTVTHNNCKFAGCYADIDAVDTTGTIFVGSPLLTVADATNIVNGSKLVIIGNENTDGSYFFAEVVSGGGTTSLVLDRNSTGRFVDATTYLIQYNVSAQAYVSSGSTDGTNVHGTSVNVHDNLFLGFSKIGMQLGTTTGSITNGQVHDNQIIKTDPMYDADVIGVEVSDSGDTAYRTSAVSIESNQIALSGGANAKGIRYIPVDNSLSSFCPINDNPVSGTTEANRFDIPDAYNPSNPGVSPNVLELSAFKEQINVRGLADFSGTTLTMTGRYARGTPPAATNITDILHTYEGTEFPEFIYENTAANAVTFVHDTSKIRLNGAVNKVVNIYETIRFIRITTTVWQQI